MMMVGTLLLDRLDLGKPESGLFFELATLGSSYCKLILAFPCGAATTFLSDNNTDDNSATVKFRLVVGDSSFRLSKGFFCGFCGVSSTISTPVFVDSIGDCVRTSWPFCCVDEAFCVASTRGLLKDSS